MSHIFPHGAYTHTPAHTSVNHERIQRVIVEEICVGGLNFFRFGWVWFGVVWLGVRAVLLCVIKFTMLSHVRIVDGQKRNDANCHVMEFSFPVDY